MGAAGGTLLGGIVGSTVDSIGAAVTGNAGHAITKGNATTNTKSFTDTVSNAISNQTMGGGFGSMGYTWTRTSTVTREHLNRKAEYENFSQSTKKGCRRVLRWGCDVGHYFCSQDNTFDAQGGSTLPFLRYGQSVRTAPHDLAAQYMSKIVQGFSNVYISFPNPNLESFFKDPKQIHNDKIAVASHPLGFLWNGFATPVNTRELAIVTPIARQDVEGVTVSERASLGVNVKSRYRKPGEGEKPSLELGFLLDHGAKTNQKFKLLVENLTKHLGVFGLTGTGKTNTTFRIIEKLHEAKVPFMVVEPAKAEYRALAQAKGLSDELVVITAGVDDMPPDLKSGSCPLRLNPFEFDQGVNLLTHIDRLKATFNASFSMHGPMPYVLEEAILEVYRERGWDLGSSRNRFVDVETDSFADYLPTLSDLYHKIDSVVNSKGYWIEQRMNIQAALKARLSSLMVGAKGTMFNCRKSIPSDQLFEKPIVVELKNIGDDDEKAFLMGLLLTRLYEYRELRNPIDDAPEHGLRHMLVVEEAHRLLKNTPDGAETMETASVNKAVSVFVDMLSEIRAYGQGVAVVDQVPSRLNANVIKGTAAKIVHRLLADDDRQTVGGCMGLERRTNRGRLHARDGPLVVHQDGQRKSLLVQD